jgi:hypothetical protein
LPIPVFASSACGGLVIDLGPDASADAQPAEGGPPLSAPDSGTSSSGETGTSSGTSSSGYGVISTQSTFCAYVAGMNANDLWCLRDADLHHWDGARWSPVTIPVPAGEGPSWYYGIAPAGPNELWLTSSYGLARVRAAGGSEDLTAQLPSLPAPNVSPRTSIARADGHVFLTWPSSDGRATTIYAYDGSHFVPLPVQNPICPRVDFPLAAPGGVLWAIGTQVVRTDGTTWTGARAWVDTFNLTITGDDFWALYGASNSEARYCPDWCHPGSPPFGQTTTQEWSLIHIASANPTVAVPVHIGLPPDIPQDGSVMYEGRRIRESASHRLATLGCVTPKGGHDHTVVHEWDGQAYGPGRALPESLGCPSMFYEPRPLDDGTWVWAAQRGGVAFVRP